MAFLFISLKSFAADDLSDSSKEGFFNKDSRKIKDIVDSYNDLSRKNGLQKSGKNTISLSKLIDSKLFIIDKSCPVDVSYEILKLAYAVKSNVDGAEEYFRLYCEEIVSKKVSDMRALPSDCSASIRSLAVSIMKIYLGDGWELEDEKKSNVESKKENIQGRR